MQAGIKAAAAVAQDTSMSRTLIFFAALLLLSGGSLIVWYAASGRTVSSGSVSEVDETYVAPAEQLTEFEFTDQLASTFNSKELDGKIWLGTFFFSDCPSICMQQNIEVSKLHKRFADQGVQFVNISVAPKDDTPARLLVYANRFGADHNSWKFLTGREMDYVKRVGNEFFGLALDDATHTSDVAVFDRQGKRQGTFNVTVGMEYAKCLKLVEELLASADKPSDGTVDDAGEVAPDFSQAR